MEADRGQLPRGHVVADRYIVERLLGRGGMGEVYAARDRKLERRVALKMVVSAASPSARRRLEAEAKAVASLEHPGIVRLHDVVEERDALFLVMEFVEGKSLRQKLEGGRLSPRAAVAFVHGIAEALEAAHARGLVHRDVKPDNVLVRPDGRTALLDFGVAKAMERDEPEPLAFTVTGEGAVVGTPAYLAPEQAKGLTVTAATDEFALAVTAYELITGTLPWPVHSLPALIAAIVSSAPLSVAGTFAGPNERADAVFARALAKAPAERYPSVSAFARALDEALGSESAGLPRPTPSDSDRGAAGPVPRSMLITDSVPEAANEPAASAAAERAAGRPTRSAARPWGWIAALALVATLAIGWALRRWSPAPASVASASPSAPASASGPGRTPVLLETLPPSGASTEADRASYRDAARKIRRGDLDGGRKEIDAALRQNPSFAGGQLLRAYASFILVRELDEPARAALRAATSLRESLSERDAELLDALAPSFLDPPRWRETAELLEAFIKKRPEDAQGHDALGFARVKLGDYAAGERAFRAEIALDPRAGLAYAIIGQILFDVGDVERGRQLFEECLRADPADANCRSEIGLLVASGGDCKAAEGYARDALAINPEARRALLARAVATAGLGAPNDVVAEFLARRRRLAPPELRSAQEAEDAFLLATRLGDFPAALEALREPLEHPESVSPADLGRFTLAQVRTLWEMEERVRAADVANAHLEHAATRPLPERPPSDPTGKMLTFLEAAGRLSPEKHASRRATWISAWRERRTETEWKREVGPLVWSAAYGAVDAPTADAARAAVEAIAALGFQAVPQRTAANPDAFEENAGDTGALMFASGRLDEAEAFLTGATRRCRIAPDQRAWLSLGQLHEKKGDTARACAAYTEIVTAWGHAKPKSVTADAAQAAAKKLGCASSP